MLQRAGKVRSTRLQDEHYLRTRRPGSADNEGQSGPHDKEQ